MTSPHPELLSAVADAQALCIQLLGTRNVLETYYPDLHDVLHRLTKASTLPACTSPWPWKAMDHPGLPAIKVAGRPVMLFVPRKRLVQGQQGQRVSDKPPKLVISHWVTKAADTTKAVTPSAFSLELLVRHGGFWAADRRGIKPLGGAPSLWCELPATDCA